jgi:hypothetical protein
MKKEALELVRRIYHLLKWDIQHGNLEEIFQAAKNQANLTSDYFIEKNPEHTEKYQMLKEEIQKIKFQMV